MQTTVSRVSEEQKITELLNDYLYELRNCTDYSIILLYKNKVTKTVHKLL